ncbi:MAG TPA: hypothetical protein ENN99_12145 [Chloroflexi bacterium]|nr:hypothetical protein [Chloroflexota bacterium]
MGTINVMNQGRQLIEAVEALNTIETGDPLEREVARLFQMAFERRLYEIADLVSLWSVEDVLTMDVEGSVH